MTEITRKATEHTMTAPGTTTYGRGDRDCSCGWIGTTLGADYHLAFERQPPSEAPQR